MAGQGGAGMGHSLGLVSCAVTTKERFQEEQSLTLRSFSADLSGKKENALSISLTARRTPELAF